MYKAMIEAIVPGANARHIEGMMRCEYSTLDGLTKTQFRRSAIECADACACDPVLAEKVAISYGL
jgi:hypothetical protein